MTWTVPRAWEGETVLLLGGGPSLKPEHIALAKTKGWRRLAINDAGLVLDTTADALCWGDPKWFVWNRDELHKYTGPYRITWRTMPEPSTARLPYFTLKHPVMPPALSFEQDAVRCNNSGHGALNLAVLFGAKRILLMGFDMKPVNGSAHWHRRHKENCGPSQYPEVYLPKFVEAAELLKSAGIEVLQCTPGSAMRCFPYADIRAL